MPLSAAEMSHSMYRRTIPVELKNYACTSHMLLVLSALDESETLDVVAGRIGISLKEALMATVKLMKLKLIEIVDGAGYFLDEGFLHRLKAELSIAVGPIAEILIEDSIRDLGYQSDTFPAFRVAELVELLARDIQKEDLRVEFQQKILACIQRR